MKSRALRGFSLAGGVGEGQCRQLRH